MTPEDTIARWSAHDRSGFEHHNVRLDRDQEVLRAKKDGTWLELGGDTPFSVQLSRWYGRRNLLQRLTGPALAQVNLELRAGELVVHLQSEIPAGEADGLPWLQREGLEVSADDFRRMASWALDRGEVARWDDEDAIAPSDRGSQSLTEVSAPEGDSADGAEESPQVLSLRGLILGATVGWLFAAALAVLDLVVAHSLVETQLARALVAAVPIAVLASLLAWTRRRGAVRGLMLAVAVAYSPVVFMAVLTMPTHRIDLMEVGDTPDAFNELTPVSHPDNALQWDRSQPNAPLQVAMVADGHPDHTAMATLCPEKPQDCNQVWEHLQDRSWSVRVIQPAAPPEADAHAYIEIIQNTDHAWWRAWIAGLVFAALCTGALTVGLLYRDSLPTSFEQLRIRGKQFGVLLLMWIPTALFAFLGSQLIGHTLLNGGTFPLVLGAAIGAMVGCMFGFKPANRTNALPAEKTHESSALGVVMLIFYVPVVVLLAIFIPPHVYDGTGRFNQKAKAGDLVYVEGKIDTDNVEYDATSKQSWVHLKPTWDQGLDLEAVCVESQETCLHRWTGLDGPVLGLQLNYRGDDAVCGTVTDGAAARTWRNGWTSALVLLALLASLLGSTWMPRDEREPE